MRRFRTSSRRHCRFLPHEVSLKPNRRLSSRSSRRSSRNGHHHPNRSCLQESSPRILLGRQWSYHHDEFGSSSTGCCWWRTADEGCYRRQGDQGGEDGDEGIHYGGSSEAQHQGGLLGMFSQNFDRKIFPFADSLSVCVLDCRRGTGIRCHQVLTRS